MLCRKCGRDIPDDAVLCCYCGTAIAPKTRTRKKRANGEGTIFQLKSGKWIATQVVGWYAEGDRLKKKTISRVFAKRTDALKALPTLKDLYTGRTDKTTLFDLYNEYIKTRDYENLSLSQRGKMTIAWNRWEPLKVIDINELTVSRIEAHIEEQTKSYYPAHDMKVLLSHLYKIAIKREVLTHNKTEDIDLPFDTPNAKRECWTAAEINALWKDYETNTFTGYLLIMCYAGLRFGELSTIRLENIYLDENYMIGGIKTEAGKNREIPIHNRIKPIIERIIPNRKRKLLEMNEDNFYNAYWEAIERTGLRKLPPHTCRHYFFSRMTAQGVQGGIIAEVGGHANYLTTLKNYVRIPLQDKLAAVNKV